MLITKNTLTGILAPATKVENVCSINWSTLDEAKAKAAKQVADLPETKELVKQLLLEIPPETNLQLESGWDSSVGRAPDYHVTGPGFNTCSRLILAGG